MSVIEEAVVDAAWREVSAIPKTRIAIEMGRASREQPELLAFILGSTEGMGAGVGELAGFTYFVIWRVFRGHSEGPMRKVTAGAIQRKLEENESSLARFDGTDPRTIDDARLKRLTPQPAVFRYMIESISEAEEDENEPVLMSPEEKGALVLLLKTAIDTLDDALERAA